jgi:hypothetical protein
MGLDMYAYAIKRRGCRHDHSDCWVNRALSLACAGEAERPDVDVERIAEEEGWEKIFYWRKHPNLHGWMERLYRQKGGTADSFNCNSVRLTLDDLDALADAVEGRLPETSGFFFGKSDFHPVERDREFIQLARARIRLGYDVYYDSWW